jgi:transcription antitermination factor NusA-like protein
MELLMDINPIIIWNVLLSLVYAPLIYAIRSNSAEIQRVIIDDQNRRIEVILTEENLSKAIGRRGQNVRLASKLINYEIDILTEKEESEKRILICCIRLF